MPINLSALSQLTNTATALGNLILVSPQNEGVIKPQTQATEKTAPENFLFDFYGEQSIILESDITDHFVEDNTAIQDQISLRPVQIKCQGYIAELNNVVPDFLKPLQTAAEKLTTIGAYTPGLSKTAILAYNQALQAYQIAQLISGSAVNAWSSITGGDLAKSKQEVAFQKLYGYFLERRLFTVSTPWGGFKDCAIKFLSPIQSADTRVVTDFEVVFKPLRFANPRIVDINGKPVGGQGRFNDAASPEENLAESGGSTYAGPDLLTGTYG